MEPYIIQPQRNSHQAMTEQKKIKKVEILKYTLQLIHGNCHVATNIKKVNTFTEDI